MNWHIEIIAAKLMALRAGKIRRLIINMPPRYLSRLVSRSRSGAADHLRQLCAGARRQIVARLPADPVRDGAAAPDPIAPAP
jgi:hypothetical protein